MKQIFDKQFDDILKDFDGMPDKLMDTVETSITRTAKEKSSQLQSVLSNKALYPAQGRYSQGLSAGMVQEPQIVWTSETSCYVRWGVDTKTYGEPYRTPVYLAYGVDGKQAGVSQIRRAIFSASILREFQDRLIEDMEKALDL